MLCFHFPVISALTLNSGPLLQVKADRELNQWKNLTLSIFFIYSSSIYCFHSSQIRYHHQPKPTTPKSYQGSNNTSKSTLPNHPQTTKNLPTSFYPKPIPSLCNPKSSNSFKVSQLCSFNGQAQTLPCLPSSLTLTLTSSLLSIRSGFILLLELTSTNKEISLLEALRK